MPRRSSTEALAAVPIDNQATRLAFSYQRVSSGQQVAGHGIERQATTAASWCATNGYELDTSLHLADKGRSAYTGKNLQGALGRFLDLCKSGQLGGSPVLLVEAIDRISRREPIDAIETILTGLVGSGARIITLEDGAEYSRQAFAGDTSRLLVLVVKIQAAHEFSKRNGMRSRANWQKRYKAVLDGEKDPSVRCRPYWLDFKDGEFSPNHHANMAKRAFELCQEGCGQNQVARQLNIEGFKSSQGKEVTTITAADLLKDRRVLGEREITNPETGEKETIANYFPSIVSLEAFNTCRELMRQRDTAPGRHHGHGKKIKNLFQGVVFCRCGSRLSYTATHGGKYEHLKCRRRVEGTCPHKNDPYWKYDEKALLLAFMSERWEKFFDRPKETIECKKTEAEVLALEGVVAEYRQQESNAEKSMKAEITSANYDRETVAFIKKVAKEANNAAEKVERQLQELRGKLQLLKARPTGIEMKQQIEAKVKGFINGSLDDLEERRKLNNWLNTLGVKATLTSPELGRFQWGDMDAVVYRDGKGGVVLDETLTSMKAFGATEEQIAMRKAEIEREVHIERQLAKGIDLRP